jgi:DNA mismatch endonuclease (patch repair protein)
MADTRTPEQRHKNMAAIHSASTKPELRLRHALWYQGFRYRVNVKRLPGSPDIVLPKYRTAIFVHGCFWHGHKDCKNASTPKTNTDFWTAKIARNQQRDQEVWRQLEAKGWFVIIVWECQLKKVVLEETLNELEAEIIKNGERYNCFQEERRLARKSYRIERQILRKREETLRQEIKDKL